MSQKLLKSRNSNKFHKSDKTLRHIVENIVSVTGDAFFLPVMNAR